jgi:pimeloyl-ACP methyl ester carboxylesterase
MSDTTIFKKQESIRKSKVKLPLLLRLIRWSFPKLEFIAPSLSYRWFARLFFSPIRYPIPAHELEIINSSERFTVTIDKHLIECYCWGEGPVILFVHGWAGRASQFRGFIESFSQNGYKIISFDAPAHGLTKGSKTSIIDFKNIILELEKKFGSIEGIIAHSLGGNASLFALSEGLKTQKLITISTPTYPEEILIEFASRINASSKSIESFKIEVVKTFNRPFNHFMTDYFASLLPTPIDWLIIHDDQDKEVAFKNAERLQEVYPSARVLKTSGLGHVRILRDEKIIEFCLNFITGSGYPDIKLKIHTNTNTSPVVT